MAVLEVSERTVELVLQTQLEVQHEQSHILLVLFPQSWHDKQVELVLLLLLLRLGQMVLMVQLWQNLLEAQELQVAHEQLEVRLVQVLDHE